MNKNSIIVLFFLLSLSLNLQAQRLFVHGEVGVINYGGDLQGKSLTLDQANKAFGAGIMYQLSDHLSADISFMSGKLAASDAKNPSTYKRNLSFYTNLTEGSLTFRASLRNVPGDAKFTPYLFGGIAVFHYDPYAYGTASKEKIYLRPLGTEGQGLPEYPDSKPYKLTQFALPFGAGITYAFSENVMVGAELNFRKLFTDHLDDVGSLHYADTAILRAARGDLSAKMSFRSDELANPGTFSTSIQRGNPDKKDVYYSCVLKLYVSLESIFGGGGGGGYYSKGARRQTGCPAKVQ